MSLSKNPFYLESTKPEVRSNPWPKYWGETFIRSKSRKPIGYSLKSNWVVCDWLSLDLEFGNPEAFKDLDFDVFR